MFAAIFLTFYLITQSAFAAPCQTLTKQPDRSVFDCAGLKVVRLSGTPVSRARAMGELLRGPLSDETVHYFTHQVAELAEQKGGIFGSLATLLYNQVVRLFHRTTPRFLAEEIDSMALGMGIDPIVLRRGLSLPDTAAFVRGLGSIPALEFLPAPGCTSIAATSGNGTFLYGRNLDFAGVGKFDRHPMLLSIEPEAGSTELRHLVIGSDGLLFGGITGVNEAGITFAIHQHFSRDAGLLGVPMILIGELVLRGARSLDEAEAIVKIHRPAGVWSFVMNDLNSGETLTIEASQRVFLPTRSKGKPFAQSNHAQFEESRAFENADPGLLENSRFRLKKSLELLESNPAPDAAALARVLSYQADPNGYLAAYHDVLKGLTLQTAIFEAAPGKKKMLYLSIGEAPASSGAYAAISFEDFWQSGGQELSSIELAELSGTPPGKRLRQREIANAYHTYFDLHRPLDAAAILESHPTLDAALFRSLANYQSRRYPEALQLAEQALHNPRFTAEPLLIRQSVETVRLASFLRQERMTEARNLAQALLEQGPVKNQLRRLCNYVLQGRPPPSWMLELTFNFFSGDLNGRKD